MTRYAVFLILLASAAAAYGQRTSGLEIWTTGAGAKRAQRLSGSTHTVYDSTDGSIYGTWSDNVVTLNDATGAQRAVLGGNAIIPNCGALSLKSGVITSEVTQVDIRCAGLTLKDGSNVTRVQLFSDVSTVAQLNMKNAVGQTTTAIRDGGLSILDTDGSVYADLNNNVINLNDATGAQRLVLGGNAIIPDCGVVTLKSGALLSEVTQVDIRCNAFTMSTSAGVSKILLVPDSNGFGTASSFTMRGGTAGNTTVLGFLTDAANGGQFYVTDASGATYARMIGGTTISRQFDMSPDGATKNSMGFTSFGAGASGYLAMPSVGTPGSVGQVLGLASANQLGWITVSGGAVTSVSSGGGCVSVSPTTGSVIVTSTGCASLSATQTFTALNTFNLGVVVALGATGSTFKVAGAFGESLFEASVANGLQMHDVFGTLKSSISRAGNVDAVSYSAGGTAGITAACTGVSLTVKAGIVINCI